MCAFGNYWLYLSILSPGFSTQSQGIDLSCDGAHQWFLHRKLWCAQVVCACTPRDKQDTWETLPRGNLLDCQKCPIAKKSQYRLLLFWQYYHIVVLQAKQENTDAYVSSVKVCVWTEKLFGMETRLSTADLAGEASCGAAWLPTGGTVCKGPKWREEKDWGWDGPYKWAMVSAGNSGKARHAAAVLPAHLALRAGVTGTGSSQGWAPPGDRQCTREVQEASFTPDLCQLILVPLSSLCQCWAGLAGVNMAKW